MRNYMDENHQDKTESKTPAAEDKLGLPPLSPKDQEKLDHLQKDRKKAKQTLRVVGISAAFVGVIVLIYIWFRFNLPLWVLISLMLSGILFLVLLIRAAYAALWTGFSNKNLWDWMDFLVKLAIPLTVVAATLVFNGQQADLARQQHQTDLQIAADQQREVTLKTCLDNIKDLLLNKSLRASKPTDEVRVVARVEVLTALRQLDGERKGLLMRFLSEAGLITSSGNDVIIALDGADLTGADLDGIGLKGARLNNANLVGAKLNNADLDGAELDRADLSGAELRNTYLRAAHLEGAKLRGAELSNASLGCPMEGAEGSPAYLSNADLSGANLSGASLVCDILAGANLSGANLTGAWLVVADL